MVPVPITVGPTTVVPATLAAIAASLNEEQVPTAQGGRQWWPSTVRAALGA